jgi:hypothetical protein
VFICRLRLGGGWLDLVLAPGRACVLVAASGWQGLFQQHGALAHDADGGAGPAGVSRSARQVYQHQAQLAKAVLFRVLRCAAGGAE